MGVWEFIQDQVLGMNWLNDLIGMGLTALGLDTGEMCIRDSSDLASFLSFPSVKERLLRA